MTTEEKIALVKYKQGVKFKSPFFSDEIFESSGDIAGSCLNKEEAYEGITFINMWIQNQGNPQPNVPVYFDGKWGEIL